MTTRIICGAQISLDQIPNRESIVDMKTYLQELVQGSVFKIMESGDRRHNYHELDYYLTYDFPSQVSLGNLGAWLEKVNDAGIPENFRRMMRRLGQKGRNDMIIQTLFYF